MCLEKDIAAAVERCAVEAAKDRIATLEAERDEARAEIERLCDPELKDLRLANGGIDMEVAGPIVERMAMAITAYFRESGATNYIEMNLFARDNSFDRYCVTVQKVGAQSPHQLRQSAEKERDDAKARITTLEAERDAMRRAYTEATTLCTQANEQRQAVEAENARQAKAIRLILPFLNVAAGEGLFFSAEEGRPLLDAGDICFAVSDALGIECGEAEYQALCSPALKPQEPNNG